MPLPHHVRRRHGTAALILSRPDPAKPPARSSIDADHVDSPDQPWPRWFAVASGVLLAAAVLGLWALLLLGDSLTA
jgi:hypothetical protein